MDAVVAVIVHDYCEISGGGIVGGDGVVGGTVVFKINAHLNLKNESMINPPSPKFQSCGPTLNDECKSHQQKTPTFDMQL